MQLNRATWELLFLNLYGWTWGQVVLDDAVNLAAARVVFDRAGGWAPWAGTASCWENP